MVHQTIIPDETMVTLSFTVPEEYIGKEVEVVAFIKQQTQNEDLSSVALPGRPVNNKAFRDWIEKAEKMPSVSLDDAKSQWEIKRASLLQSSR